MNLATFLIILWVIVLIGICYLVKRLNTIEKKMIEIHNHLIQFMQKEYSHHFETTEVLNQLNDMLQSAQDSRNAVHLKLDNLQKNWSDLKVGK